MKVCQSGKKTCLHLLPKEVISKDLRSLELLKLQCRLETEVDAKDEAVDGNTVVLNQNKEEWNHWGVKREMSWQLYNLGLEMTVKEEHEKKRSGKEDE